MAVAVKLISRELVVPSHDTPRQPLWLSNLDLSARKGYTPVVYFYRPPATGAVEDTAAVAERLRAALGEALVRFYPLAGRLGVGPDGRFEVDCNAEGAVFVVASSEASVNEFADFAPSDAVRDLFVPAAPATGAGLGCVLLMIQVTFFKCGGIAVGTAMHHFIIDGRCAFHFVETWASIARTGSAATVPVPHLDRTLLRARPSPTVLFDHRAEYMPSPSPYGYAGMTYASAILHVGKSDVDRLKTTAAASTSTFRALVAHIWRCTCLARELPAEAESRLFTMVDVRSRMAPPLPATYFGNAVLRTSVAAKVGELVSSPLSFGARRVRGATSQGDEFARSLIDFLETADNGSVPRSGLPRTDLRVISWLGMPMHAADMGFGEPAAVGPAVMYYSGFVYLMNGKGKAADGVDVAVALEPESMERFKELFMEGFKVVD